MRVTKEERETWKKLLSDWLTERVRANDVPRISDVMGYVRREGIPLTRKEVSTAVRLHHAFMMSMHQQRTPPSISRSWMPIVATNLGHWHCDIGYFSVNARYETPKSYRNGFLVAKDVLSRYVYATPLLRDKSADSMIRAFKALFEQHAKQYDEKLAGMVDGEAKERRRRVEAIKSISFDKETSVMSKKVQQYLKDSNIAFHAFRLSSSKAKHAENAIRQIRSVMAKLMRLHRKEDRWWTLLPVCVKMMNSKPVVVEGKYLGMAPKDVNGATLAKYLQALQKAVPSYYWAQYSLDPSAIDFKYRVGDKVRILLIVTTSQVIGVKRSENNVTEDLYVVEKKLPYVTKNMRVGKAYRIVNLRTGERDTFEEQYLVPGVESDKQFPYLEELQTM